MSYLTNLIGRLVNALFFAFDLLGPTVKFQEPLTVAAPRVPGPAMGVAADLVPEPSTSQTVPAVSTHGLLPNPPGVGLVAWDCILNCDQLGGCLNSYGDPVRAGQSCYSSARLMSMRGFAAHHPDLHAKAVRLGILTAVAS